MGINTDDKLWAFILPLPRDRDRRDKLLKTLFSSETMLEVLFLVGSGRAICQRDIVNALSQHSNKTVLKAIRGLVETGVLVEEVVETTRSGRRIRLKCYRLSSAGKWIYLLLAPLEKLDDSVIREEVTKLYRKLGESIADTYMVLGIDPNEILMELFESFSNRLVKHKPGSRVFDIAIAGSTNMYYHLEAREDYYTFLREEPGGSGVVVANMLGGLGTRTTLISSIGLDYDGFKILSRLYTINGISLDNLVIYRDKITLKTLVVHKGLDVETKSFIGREVAIAPEPYMVNWRSIKAEVYCAADTYIENMYKLCSRASEDDKLFVLKPGLDNISYSPRGVVEVIQECKPIVALSSKTHDALKEKTSLDAHDLINLGARAVIVGISAYGARLFEKRKVKKYTVVEASVIDPLGASDALLAYTLWGLRQGMDLDESVKWGVAAAALMATRLGVGNPPSINDVSGIIGKTSIE